MFSRYGARWLIAIAIAALPITNVYANFINQVCGNTRPQLATGVGGTVNFAVLDQKDGEVGDPWGTGYPEFARTFVPGVDVEGTTSPRLDYRARYLYVYQIVNDGKNEVPIVKNGIRLLVDPLYITSWGFFSGMSLADNKGKGLQGVSFSNTFGNPATAQDPGGVSLGVNGPQIILVNNPEDPGRDPSQVGLVPQTFYAAWKKDPLLFKQRGTLFGFTTNLPPKLDQTTIHPKPPKP